MRKRLVVSVSGGRTSGYMAKMLKDNAGSEYDMKFIFANTGLEHKDTLRFVNDIDINFGLNLIWVEAAVNHGERKSTGHKFINYSSASQSGQPMEEVISKYGIPNVSYPHCTRELKLNPMNSALRSIGWGDAYTAVGIRADESRRVSSAADTNKIIYPLIDMFPSDKQDVLTFWEDYSWDLAIPEWQGNCQGCFKKSFKKLMQVHSETPEVFDFTRSMEAKYGRTGAEFTKRPETPDRVFFRENRDTNAMEALFKHTKENSPYAATRYISQTDAGCSESCEVYPTEECKE